MSNHSKFVIITGAFLILSGLVWWWKTPKPIRPIPAHPSDTPLTTPSAEVTSSQSTLAAAVTPQPDKGHSGDVATHQKFSEMEVLKRIALLNDIKQKDLATIFQLFLDAGRIDHDQRKQTAIQGVLTQALKKQPLPPEFLEKMRLFVVDRSNTKHERGLIVSAFASAGTKEGSEFALWVATGQPNQDLKNGAIDAISYMGSGGYRDYLPPAIEPIWNESSDARLLRSVAAAMAKEGAPSSIELLLSAALAPEGQDDMRREIAMSALQCVYTKNAVPPLVEVLGKNPVGSPANTLAFNTLEQIVQKEAPQAMINWLQTADSKAAPMAKEWIADAKTPSQLEAAKAAIDPKVSFRNEANREALRAGLEAYKAGHKVGK